MTTTIIDKEYYEKNPEYAEVHCIHCKEPKLRLIGIECYVSDYNSDDDYEKNLYKCENCGQCAYIDIEWIFTITIP